MAVSRRFLLQLLGGSIGSQLAPPLPAADNTRSATQRLHELMDDFMAEYLVLNPELAWMIGDDRYLDRFGNDLSDAYERRERTLTRSTLRRLQSIPRRSLDEFSTVSYDVLAYGLQADLDAERSGMARLGRMLPIEHVDGRHNGFAQDASGAGRQPFRNESDYRAALRRAAAFSTWIDWVIRRLREGLAAGWVLPRLIVERLLPQLRIHFESTPTESVFYQPLVNWPDAVPQAARPALTEAYRKSIEQVIQPAYRRLHDFLASTYLPHARASFGLCDLKDGDRYYQYLIRRHTTTDATPSELHATGLKEMERIHAGFRDAQQRLGHSGSLPEFFKFMRSNPPYLFRDAQEILAAYEGVRQRVAEKLPALFVQSPRADYTVKPVPEFSAPSYPAAAYQPPTADGSRAGVFWINTYAPTSRPRYQVTATSLHEAVPGHHFQMALMLENPNLPRLQRLLNQEAFMEGWALYAESLGEDMQLYGDPVQYVGFLALNAMRAARLVVDTGIHAFGWTRTQALAWMTDHTPLTQAEIQAEVDRYIAMPGQALAYKVGQLTISELRAHAQTQLGAAFDLREFHGEILRYGSPPMQILRRANAAWLEKRTGSYRPN